MAKELICRDLGIACNQVIRAETEEELLERVVEHALTVHGIDLMQVGLLEQIKAAVREDKAS